MSFIAELNRRSVFRVGAAYAVTAWMVLTIVRNVSSTDWVVNLLFIILAVGFLPALIVAWHYELTPSGIKLHQDTPPGEAPRRKPGRKLEYAVIIMLGLSLGIYVWESRFKQRVAEHEARTAQAEAAAEAAAAAAKRRAPRISDPALIEPNSIAVLPFDNLGAGPEDQYFTDGIHEDLLTQLSKIDAFSVISRGSVMEYRDTAKKLRQIADELSVASVVAGSVQRAGNRVRINVQMIDADTDEVRWAELYDRELTTGNLFDIQTETAQAVAAALKTTLTAEELADVAAVPTDSVDAYDLYLRGRQFAQRETLAGNRSAIEQFQQSVTLDPEFKNAWIGLARAHMSNYWVHGGDPANRELARTAIDRARDIDPDFGELYMAEGFYWYWGHLDYERALYYLDKAIDLMPGSDEGHMWRGWVSRRAGLWEQALDSMREALRLNPRVAFNWHEYALTLLYQHRYQAAQEAVAEARRLEPDSVWGKATEAAIALQASGDVESALALTAGALPGEEFDYVNAFFEARVLARRFDEALQAARQMPESLEIRRNLIALKEARAAQILHFMGQHEAARQAAGAALFRLKNLRAELGDDYRLDLAEAMVRTVQGAAPEAVRALVSQSESSKPDDAMEAIRIRLEHARIFAIAGLAEACVDRLAPLLAPPSDTSIHKVALDAAFDSVREHPQFIAMMQRHQ